MTVGFGIAPNLLTLPALSSGRRSRAGRPVKAVITAGGDFHPALRTLPPHRRRHDYADNFPRNKFPVHSANRLPHGANACVETGLPPDLPQGIGSPRLSFATNKQVPAGTWPQNDHR
jgi:hypothetical protein